MVFGLKDKFNNKRIFNIAVTTILVFSSLSISAQEMQTSSADSAAPGQDSALEDLLKVLDQETEIATKTKLNIDFVPGMVSVLQGKDLQARGVRTVFEALALIPGVELSLTNDGQYQVVVRGVGKTYSSAKVKFLLNGVSFNTTLNAITTAFVIPIDLVDRIEVIRGPGSAIYGEFASVGVINVITNKKTGSVFSRYSDNHRYTVGAQYNGQVRDAVTVGANFAYEKNKGGDVQAGDDILASSPNAHFRDISNSPGPINDKEVNKVFSLNLGYRQFQVLGQVVERYFGDYFGAANALPVDEQVAQRETSLQNIEMSNRWELGKELQSNVKVGWLRFELDSSQLTLFPETFTAAFPDGVLGAPNYLEDKYYGGFDVSYKGIEKHNVLLGVDYSMTKQGETYAERNYYVQNGGLSPIANGRYTGDKNWMAEGLSRRVFAVYAQDQYSIATDWVITAGLRWDDYSDIGNDFTPRLAAVYQLSDRQTFKAQYAQSFRPPTFLEQYSKNNVVVSGNPDLKPERLENVELGYVYNDGLTIGRVTAFYYDLKDLIAINTTTRRYENVGNVHARGIELELTKQLWKRFKIDSNVSYTHANDANGMQIFGVAELLGNVGLIFKATNDINVTAQYRYVGGRARQVGDDRPDLKAYNLVDLTVNKSDLLFKGVTLRAGVKNLFDEKVVYPAFLVRAPDGQERPAYEGDYPQPGREFVIQLSWQFK